jgi:Cu(I)/Ag(I) efflux system membrane fusion protein
MEKMKNKQYIFWLLFILSFSLFSCNGEKKISEENKQNYTCPMHPQIVKDKMDSCPICGMDLVPMNSQNSKENTLMLSNSQIKLANIKTIKLADGDYQNQKELKGILQSNPLENQVISSKFAGRVEKLYVKETGVLLSKGQPIYQIYSEDLSTLQQDYLLNLNQMEAFPDEKIYKKLTEAVKRKLLLFGYNLKQINELEKGKNSNPRITVYANEGGLVNEINISEGQYISEGMSIFSIGNLNTLWVEADIYPSEIENIKLGQSLKVIVNGFEDIQVKGKIDFINPQYDNNSRVIKLRTHIKNIDFKFHPGMFASVILEGAQKSAILKLPVQAVLRDEKGAHIWIKTDEHTFEAKDVTVGEENESTIIIEEGLNGGENVVINGAYLLYSEYKLKKGNI